MIWTRRDLLRLAFAVPAEGWFSHYRKLAAAALNQVKITYTNCREALGADIHIAAQCGFGLLESGAGCRCWPAHYASSTGGLLTCRARA